MRKLSEKQEVAALFLGLGCDYIQTAAIIGVHRATLWRWRKNDLFVKTVLAHKLAETLKELAACEQGLWSGHAYTAYMAARRTLKIIEKAEKAISKSPF